MSRVRSIFPDHEQHLGGGKNRDVPSYSPKFTHEDLDMMVERLLSRDAAYWGAITEGIDALYVPLSYTFSSVAAGGTWSGSVPWTNRSLCNHLRVEMTTDSELELKLLRKPVFDSNIDKHTVFHADAIGNKFMREGGALFDFQDETGGVNLHVWFKNKGTAATTVTLLLNSRVPQ